MFGIKIFENRNLLTSAIIGSNGGGTGIHKDSIIFEDTRILICCSDSIFCLSIPNLELVWRIRPEIATCFGIYKYQDSYIVHGELTVSKLDKDGKIVWQRSGADIFITIDGKQSFQLTDKFIIVLDFENRIYKFDYDGNDLTDVYQF